MRILHLITRSEIGGAQAVVAGLASELSKAGHEVAIASGEEGGGCAWKGLSSQIELFEVDGLGRSMSVLADIAALSSVRKLYRQWKPDIVHLHTSKAAALGRLANGIDSRRIVYTMHGYDQIRSEHRLYLPIDRMLARKTGAIVAVSKCDQKAMRGDGYDPLFIPNGVPDAKLESPLEEGIVRRLRSLKAAGLAVVLLVAREAAPKRIDIARATAALMRNRAAIVWIGGNPRKGDPDSFHALGKIPRAASYMAHADLLMLPSEHEGMPVSVLEAFSASLPVVVSAVEGCLEVTGLNCEGVGAVGIATRNTSESFAAAIDRIEGSPQCSASMGNAARKLWELEYSLSKMTGRYIALYSNLLSLR